MTMPISAAPGLPTVTPTDAPPGVSRGLAQELADHLDWTPRNGDLFFIPRPEIAESEFLVSDMVVELITRGGESRFHFNGTVEWALDSVESEAVVWLPREDQLRALIGDAFLSLDASSAGFVVGVGGTVPAFHTAPEPTAAEAYGRALLHVLSHRAASPS